MVVIRKYFGAVLQTGGTDVRWRLSLWRFSIWRANKNLWMAQILVHWDRYRCTATIGKMHYMLYLGDVQATPVRKEAEKMKMAEKKAISSETF